MFQNVSLILKAEESQLGWNGTCHWKGHAGLDWRLAAPSLRHVYGAGIRNSSPVGGFTKTSLDQQPDDVFLNKDV